MTIIPQPPFDVNETQVIKLLSEKSAPSDGAAERAQQFIQAATPLLDLIIGGPFKEYTLHNRDHAKKLLHLAEFVIPAATLESLSSLEYLILIYSAYLHDMGMCLTSTERERLLISEEFADTLRGWPEIWHALDHARQKLDSASEQERLVVEATIYQLQEAALCAHLRPRHATPQRYKALIDLIKTQSNRSDLFEFRGISFESVLIDVCTSHNLDVGVLAEINGPYDERFPRSLALAGERVNTQFCAAALRLIDILDFDRERTPRVLFESLGIESRSLPGADITLREWQKHMSIHTIEINQDEIVISAECHHPVIEKAIRDFCQIIEREIRDTLAVIRRNTPEVLNQYTLELPVSVRPSIRSIGYVFKDLSLRLNQSAIISLLMGERLYSQPIVAVRELLQNSIDACAARQLVDEGYKANMEVNTQIDDSDRCWIEVKDNGIGMDEYVLSEYFLKLGNSYYDSPEFQRICRRALGDASFSSIARFGIGIVSVFLIADVLEVTTRRSHSVRGDSATRFVRIERLGGLAFFTESSMDDAGTRIRIRLKAEYNDKREEFIGQIRRYLRDVVIKPKFGIKVDLFEKSFILRAGQPMSLKQTARPFLDDSGIEAFVLDLSRWSNRVSGVAIILLAKTEDNRLSNTINGRRLVFGGDGGIDPHRVIEKYPGNRVTVNGFRMLMKKMESIVAGGKKQLGIAYDIDIVGDEEIVYDVSRERIIGDGRTKVAKAFRDAVKKGLDEIGVTERLTEDTKNVFERIFGDRRHTIKIIDPNSPYLEPMDQEMLRQVAELLPNGVWPKGINKIIALQLGISTTYATKLITRLLRTGVVSNPKHIPVFKS